MTENHLPAQPVAKPEAQVKPYRTLTAAPESLLTVAASLRDEHNFKYLDMVTAVDWKGAVTAEGYIEDPNPNPYLPKGAVSTEKVEAKANPKVEYKDVFDVVYLFSDLDKREKVALRVSTPRANPSVPSLVSLFATADWQEREVFDLYGIRFEGHPNLTKILTPEFLAGHPLRKDYVHQKDYLD